MYQEIQNYVARLMTSRPDLPLWNIESIRQGKKPAWNYIDGCMTASLLSLYEATGDEKYFDFVRSFADYYVHEDGTILGYDPTKYSTDDVSESRILFDLYDKTKEEKYLRAIRLVHTQVEKHPRTKEGNFFHKAMYHDQVWLDGLYMMQPFCTRYQTRFGNKDYSDIVHQFQNVRALMFDEKKKLYYHGYDSSRTLFWADKKTGHSQSFWLRSIGWFLVALIDVYSYMDESKKEDREAICSIFQEAIDGVLLYQDDKTKMFYQVVDQGHREGNYLETSGSSMIAFALLKGARLGALAPEYAEKGKAIFDGIAKRNLSIAVDGTLNLKDICLVAGLGPENNTRRDGSYAYYVSEPIVENDAKGVGPFIMAYTEVIQMK